MTRIEHTKQEIARMSFEERSELMSWMRGCADDAWDRQMKQDAAEGRLDGMLADVDRAIEKDEPGDMP